MPGFLLPTTPVSKGSSYTLSNKKRARSASPAPAPRKNKIISIDGGSPIALPVKASSVRPRRPDTPRPSPTAPLFTFPFVAPSIGIPSTPVRGRRMPQRGTPHPRRIIPPSSPAEQSEASPKAKTPKREDGSEARPEGNETRDDPPRERWLLGYDSDGEPMYRDEISDYFPSDEESDPEDDLITSAWLERRREEERRRQAYLRQLEWEAERWQWWLGHPASLLNKTVPIYVASGPWDQPVPVFHGSLPVGWPLNESPERTEPLRVKEEEELPRLGTPGSNYTSVMPKVEEEEEYEEEQEDDGSLGDDEASSPIKLYMW